MEGKKEGREEGKKEKGQPLRSTKSRDVVKLIHHIHPGVMV